MSWLLFTDFPFVNVSVPSSCPTPGKTLCTIKAHLGPTHPISALFRWPLRCGRPSGVPYGQHGHASFSLDGCAIPQERRSVQPLSGEGQVVAVVRVERVRSGEPGTVQHGCAGAVSVGDAGEDVGRAKRCGSVSRDRAHRKRCYPAAAGTLGQQNPSP